MLQYYCYCYSNTATATVLLLLLQYYCYCHSTTTSYTLMTVGAPIPIGILLNSQTIQLYSVYCITMRQAMALCYTTLLNGVINRICA